jgi:hypothetical protein
MRKMSFFASLLLLLLLSLDTVWAQRRIGGVHGVSGYPQPQASWVLSAIGNIQVKQKRHACELHCQPR